MSSSMPRIIKELGNFTTTDPTGKVHRLFARQEFTVAHGIRAAKESPAGPLLLNLADGTAVTRPSKGVYEISVGKVKLTSNDQAAV
jgi:hypothetical protein